MSAVPNEGPVVDQATGEILAFNGPTVPMAAFRELEFELIEAKSEVDAQVRALAASNRARNALQREIDDLLDQSADRDTVRKCLIYWRDRTGRGPKTRIDLATGRAKHVRWFLRHWTPREFCLAVVGIMCTQWFVEHGKTDVAHLMTSGRTYDEGRAEEFIARGWLQVGERAS